MPIYEYTCEKCDKRFDQLVRSISAEVKPPCPACGSAETARALSVVAVGADAGGGGKSSAGGGGDAMCGRCGGMPGSCQM
jgi:putative FmdB family regulatory protein